VSEFESGTVIDPNSPTMYVGFSGVLHCGEGPDGRQWKCHAQFRSAAY
jgi:hypothetical protein